MTIKERKELTGSSKGEEGALGTPQAHSQRSVPKGLK